MLPVEARNLLTDRAWATEARITMAVSAAESYALSLSRMLPLLVTEGVSGEGEPIHTIRDEYRTLLNLVPGEPDDDTTVWVEVICEVLYIRSVDIAVEIPDYEREEDEGLMVSELSYEATQTVESDDPVDGADGEQIGEDGGDQAGEAATADVSVRLEDHEIDPGLSSFLRAEAVNRAIGRSNADDLPGGSLRFIGIADERITMRRTWQYGMAVAVRGVALEVDKNTGRLVQIQPMGWSRRPPAAP